MNKRETLGYWGENQFLGECIKRGLKAKDNRFQKVFKKIKNRNADYECWVSYSSHECDFEVNDKKIEVKTAMLRNNKWNWCLVKNDLSKINFVVCIGVDDTDKHFFIIPTPDLYSNKAIAVIKGKTRYDWLLTYRDRFDLLVNPNAKVNPIYKKYLYSKYNKIHKSYHIDYNKKFYLDRNKKINKMREKGKTLQTIGNKFKLSRQRIHQILNST